jgi:hypothetical protein
VISVLLDAPGIVFLAAGVGVQAVCRQYSLPVPGWSRAVVVAGAVLSALGGFLGGNLWLAVLQGAVAAALVALALAAALARRKETRRG